MKKAMYWDFTKDNKIQCHLCPHQCVLSENQNGICRVRGVRNNELQSLYYGQIASGGQIDPMEKKPLYHYYPGTPILSFGGASCNLQCQHCQNYTISQTFPTNIFTTLSVEKIHKLSQQHNCTFIAWTYNEPFISYETYLDYSKYLKGKGYNLVWVTNGYIQQEPLQEMLPYIDAANIDIKAFTETFYQKYTHSRLAPVLETCKTLKKHGKHIELTYLIIPTLNDNPEEIQEFLQWTKQNLGTDIALHFSRFHPQYKLRHLPSTPPETITNTVKQAKQFGFPYAYPGNLPHTEDENTICPNCQNIIIQRQGYIIKAIQLTLDNTCPKCNHPIPIITTHPQNKKNYPTYTFVGI
ncbi:MAG TPA: AmmeMemoRadiSam system radical SAM enzyme [Planctomycetota bacterium]|nr:AmmeMemoRadiSam system radical SAM enzyme [Planctomycetota bacterium]HQA99700.1 AmmeMemoRadiSam system radical SAM enzyme [Planctomycetota bacterium]